MIQYEVVVKQVEVRWLGSGGLGREGGWVVMGRVW